MAAKYQALNSSAKNLSSLVGGPFGTGSIQNTLKTQDLQKKLSDANASLSKFTDAQKLLDQRPDYLSIANKDGTGLQDAFTSKAGPAITADTSGIKSIIDNVNSRGAGFQALQNEATRTGPSQWATGMMQKIGLQAATNRDKAATQANQAAGSALSNLAMNGGASGGARERLMGRSGLDAFRAQQDITRNAQLDTLGVQTQDEQNRLNQLNNFVGAEQAANATDLNRGQALQNLSQYQTGLDEANRNYQTGVDQFNLSNLLKDRGAQNDFNQNTYGQKMNVYASEKLAQDTEKACFAPGTLVEMEDGTEKTIESLEPGDRVKEGGMVTAIMKCDGKGEALYKIGSTLVTGGHMVFKDGEWMRVKNSGLGVKQELDSPIVYNLITENHAVVMGGIIFSDYEELDWKETEDLYLELKNKRGRAA